MSALKDGLCECGCGQKTSIPTETSRKNGRIKGQPMRFVSGHNSRGQKLRKGPDWKREDRGYKTPCLIWQHGLTDGYGKATVPGGGKQQYTHILQWEAEHGPVPDGLELDHLCRQRACGEHMHLEPVTRAENVRRGLAPAMGAAAQLAKTHCPKGHPYSGENLYVSGGRRHCKECRRQETRRRACGQERLTLA